MKPLSIFILGCFTALSVFAQNNIIVNITLNGNNNREILIDGKTYLLSDYVNTSTNNKNKITVADLQPGQHTLQVIRNNKNNNRRNARNERIFNLRTGYDLDIVVNGNGSMQQTEKRNFKRNNSAYRTPMTSTNFNTLVQDVKRKWTNSSRITTINTVLTNPSNYFTTIQASQLIQMVSGDASRVQLLKTSYRSITDPNNFSNLYALLSTQAYRDDVAAYVNAYATTNGNTTGTNNPGYRTAMSNYNFNLLATDIRNEMRTDARVNAINNAFSNSGNYFTTDQARQLIQMITGEATILHLAKASYRSIIDTDNFATIYNMLPTQASRNDLSAYVRTYNPNVTYTGTVSGSTTYRTPMADATFNTLLSDIRSQWLPGAKKSAVISAFATGNNYFTTAQARQLIQLDNDEPDRLDMAKASYRTIVDPQNFSQVYDLFPTQAYRDDLAAYVSANR